MDSLKLAGTLPVETDRNGLDSIAAQVVKDPTTLVPVIMLVDCKLIGERTDTGDKVGTLRVRRIEPVGPQDLEAAHRLFRKVLERRTGKNALPIEDQDEIDSAFGSER
jgi:hypothetical protein